MAGIVFLADVDRVDRPRCEPAGVGNATQPHLKGRFLPVFRIQIRYLHNKTRRKSYENHIN